MRNKNKKQEKEKLPPGAEAARREMLHHLKGRFHRTPHKLLKQWMHKGNRPIWAAIIKADKAPRKEMYLPGAR